jgi:hypothetical protein
MLNLVPFTTVPNGTITYDRDGRSCEEGIMIM